jgi:hypothetical protein
MVCDIHGCCNPFHSRWGTKAENMREAKVLSKWRDAFMSLNSQDKQEIMKDHPARRILSLQGIHL